MKLTLKGLCLGALVALATIPASAACSYSIGSATVGAGGGYVSVPIYTQAGCRWTLSASNPSWSVLVAVNSQVSGLNGMGSGYATWYAYPNATKSNRVIHAYVGAYTSGLVVVSESGTIGGRSSTGAGVVMYGHSVVTELGK